MDNNFTPEGRHNRILRLIHGFNLPELQDRCATPTQATVMSASDAGPESCPVPPNDAVFQRYHDEEWGVPASSDQVFFEKICLEGFQSGLSWKTILHRREGFRQAFDYFDPQKLRRYTETDVARLTADKRIIRNRRKILSTINNAHRLLELQAETGSLATFIWSFEPHATNRPEYINRQWLSENPCSTESEALCNALKRRGWSFVGPTNLYAMMQALGIVNDHVRTCPRHSAIERLRQAIPRPLPIPAA